MNFLKAMFGNYSKREVKRVQPICDKVLALEDKYAAMSESELKNQTTILKERLANGETTDDILPEANPYILQNHYISFRSRMLQYWASKKQFWVVRLYNQILMKLVYGVLYK